MDKRITEKTDMFGRVKKVCNDNIAIVSGIPKLKTYFEGLKQGIEKVELLKQRLSTSTTGIAEEKGGCWHKLALALDKVCAALRAYANDQGNTVLYKQAGFSQSAFQQMRCGDAVSFSNAMLALVGEHIAGLGEYNVMPSDLTAAQQLTGELDKLNPEPVASITTDMAVRKALFEAVGSTNDLLRTSMDNVVRTLLTSEPLFFDEYQFARKMRHPGLRHRQPEPPEMPTTEQIALALAEGAKKILPEMPVLVPALPVGANGAG